MTVRRLTAVDAQTYWLSTKVPSDQFLAYGFAGEPADLPAAIDAVLRRADACDDLGLRVRDRGAAAYPVWAPCDRDERRSVVHRLDGAAWADCLTAIEALSAAQLDAREATWRLHVFPSIGGIPDVDGAGTVAVVQMSHALADGVRASALAAWLFGRPEPVSPVAPPRWAAAALPRRALAAARAHRQLARDVASGAVAAQGESFAVRRSNARPDGVRSLRTLVRHRRELTGPTVTVTVLTAVSEALAGHLRELGDDPAGLGAEVPMARAGKPQAHNHFGNVSVDLFPGLPARERAQRIAAVLAERRRRAGHPALIADREAFAALPAPLLRWGVAAFDPDVRSARAIGNTVVSSVSRGAADLRFGDLPVVLTTDSMPLSPMMGLTHGVHGIGDTVTVSVHAAESAIGDVDAYTDRLAAALDAGRF